MKLELNTRLLKNKKVEKAYDFNYRAINKFMQILRQSKEFECYMNKRKVFDLDFLVRSGRDLFHVQLNWMTHKKNCIINTYKIKNFLFFWRCVEDDSHKYYEIGQKSMKYYYNEVSKLTTEQLLNGLNAVLNEKHGTRQAIRLTR